MKTETRIGRRVIATENGWCRVGWPAVEKPAAIGSHAIDAPTAGSEALVETIVDRVMRSGQLNHRLGLHDAWQRQHARDHDHSHQKNGILSPSNKHPSGLSVSCPQPDLKPRLTASQQAPTYILSACPQPRQRKEKGPRLAPAAHGGDAGRPRECFSHRRRSCFAPRRWARLTLPGALACSGPCSLVTRSG